MAGLLGLAAVVVFSAVLFVPRFLRACRARAAGTAVVSPQRPPAAGGTTAPAQPRGEATRPFSYDDGLTIGDKP